MKIETLLVLASVVCAISFTITTTSMFKWLREPVSNIHHKLEELIHCPYCLSHWITFVILLLPGISLYSFTGLAFIDFMMTAFAIVGISALGHYVLLRAYEPVAKAMVSRQIEKLRSNNGNS